MARPGRPELTDEQKAIMWQCWRQGDSLSHIGRVIHKHPASVFGVLRLFGGIPPVARHRKPEHLSFTEREEISRGLAAGDSIRQIAISLVRAPSTISREINRNGGVNRYRALRADEKAWERARRPKPCALAKSAILRRTVTDKLKLDWSPEQISGWLKQCYPDDESMQVSHETIYKSLFIQSRGVLKKELQKHLRTGRVFRKSRAGNKSGMQSRSIKDGVSISERPAEVEDRAIPGHWKGDLIAGSGNTYIATLVERQSRFALLVKVSGKDTQTVVDALTRKMMKLPETLRQSLTWDRGSELADHKSFTVATDMQVYFCDPQSPWQRGTNENTNRLLRQYFPKKTNLAGHSQIQLDKVALLLNQRPRKTLEFLTPADKLNEVLR